MRTGDVISYLEMCAFERASLQRGMNYHLSGAVSVVLMSTRYGAPYEDRIESEGRVLIYEGHDEPRSAGRPEPKTLDQPMRHDSGTLTQNGRFFESTRRHRDGEEAELVRVYEKVKKGIWVYNGTFELVDAWSEPSGGRDVFKFRLELMDHGVPPGRVRDAPDHNRVIPSTVKQDVWKRDRGRCVTCGAQDLLHFDHVIPFSKGGASVTAENIQLLCARHNLEKRDKIQ